MTTRHMAMIISLLLTGTLIFGGCTHATEPTPGKSLLDRAHLLYNQSVAIKPGETKTIEITLETGKDGPGMFKMSIYRVGEEYSDAVLPMPDGLKVNLEPESFMMHPHNTYHAEISISASSALETGEYWLRLDQTLEGVFQSNGWIRINVQA